MEGDQRCNEEGAKIVLSNAPVAMRFGKINELGEKINAPIFCRCYFDGGFGEAVHGCHRAFFGGKIDFVLHSIGMSMNVRKGKPYTDLNYDFMAKTFDISAMSFHRVMQTLWKQEAMNDWGSITALTYIAAQRVLPDYSEMAESKALLESFARSFGYHFHCGTR